MQLKNLTTFSTILILFLGSCTVSEEEIIQIETPQPIDIQMNINNEEDITYIFDECNFNAPTQSPSYSEGTWGTFPDIARLKGFGTTLSNEITRYKLTTSMNFKYEGIFNEDKMEEIISTELNTRQSSSLVFSVKLIKDGIFYQNYYLEKGQGLSTLDMPYTYYPEFNYEITEYEVGYQSDCEEDEAIKIKGYFEGMLYAELGSGITDSLYINVPEFETMILID